jgi:cobalt-zinc-cadmium efflux system membrane fusion protein
MSQSVVTRRETVVPPPQAAAMPSIESRGRFSFRGSLRKALPIVAVVGLLAGVAVWGHSTDWTMPKFSALFGTDAGATPGQCIPGGEGWCKEHGVPEAICIECNHNLAPPLPDYGWCKEHGIAQCPLEHPDVAQLQTSPVVTAADIERANRALALLPRNENSSRCKNYQRRIQFVSQEAVDKSGIDIAVVDQEPLIEAIAANGEVIYDQTHSAHLASRVAGTVWRVEKHVGEQIHKGDILTLIDSTDVGKAKTELLTAITEVRLAQINVDRLKPLASGGAVPGKQLTEAETGLAQAKIRWLAAQQTLINLGLPIKADEIDGLSTEEIAQKIQFLGLPASLTSSFDSGATTSNLFPLRAPLDGVVVDCKVVAGETVDTSTTIFGVADLRRMWLMLNVRQDEAKYLSIGQPVRFHASNSKDEREIKGSIAWISTEADDKTRTVKVRADLPNTDGHLRANTFGVGQIVLRDESQAIVIPTEAVHSDGDCTIVFVRDKDYLHDGSPKFFHIREVRLGVRGGETTEVIAGLLPGEVVASKNSMVLEAQLLKSNLGAGCPCCAPTKK